MALPSSRNRTYGAASPVRSADLDDIQDCIIGHKHGDLVYTLGFASFRPRTADVATLIDTNAYWETSSAGVLRAPLVMPAGTRIRTMQWSYNRGGAGTLDCAINRMNIITGVATLVDSFSDATGTGIESTTRTVNYTNVVNNAFYLTVVLSNAAHLFYGVEIIADRL